MSKKVSYPIGLRCTNIRYMTSEEMEREGWTHIYAEVPVIEFSDGSIIYPSTDPEGNGPGMIFGMTKNQESIYVVPVEEANDN